MEYTLSLPLWHFAIIILLVTITTRLWPRKRETSEAAVNARLREAYHELIDAFHHSKWLSAGVVGDMLHGLSQGDSIDVDHLRDYNAVQYLQLNGFSQSQIQEILDELDDEGERIGPTNVGNVTGIGDDILPNLYQEAARLVRAQFAEIEVLNGKERQLQESIDALRDELQSKHLQESLSEG